MPSAPEARRALELPSSYTPGEACDEVEYWGREAWRPVCAHADIDERCARERGELRFPAAVLVVYVQVEPGLRAPTVLWAELPGGAPVLCAVPAVPGRLLRFDGEMLHAVPQPLTQHLTAAAAEAEIQAEAEAGAAATAGAEAAAAVEADGAGAERRVLLINCWDQAPDDNAPTAAAPAAAAPTAAVAAFASSPVPSVSAAGMNATTAVASAADATDAAGSVRTRCEPRSSWRPLAVDRCRAETTAGSDTTARGDTTAGSDTKAGGDTNAGGDTTARGDTTAGSDTNAGEGTRLSTALFGAARPLVMLTLPLTLVLTLTLGRW